MKVSKLIELLQALPDHERNIGVIVRSPEEGMYVHYVTSVLDRGDTPLIVTFHSVQYRTFEHTPIPAGVDA